MELSKELLKIYLGGQLVSTIEDAGVLQRGQISEIQFSRDAVNVKFAWQAENTGTPSEPTYVWEKIEPRNFVLEIRLFNFISLLDDDNRVIQLDGLSDSEPESDKLRPLFFWSSGLNMRVIFMPPGDDTEIQESDIVAKVKEERETEVENEKSGAAKTAAPAEDVEVREYILAICRARNDHNGERLVCCLNSEDLPQFDPEHVVLEVRKTIGINRIHELKEELRQKAAELGLTNVVNLAATDLQPTIGGGL
jgi:hypothetical protein